MSFETLRRKIEAHEARVVVIGLGYVGLPLAVALAHDGYGGFPVVGLDVCEERVRLVNAGLWPLDQQEPVLPRMLKKAVEAGNLSATDDYEICRGADVIVVCVPTPINEHKEPNYSALWQAITGIAQYARAALVIIESTLAPHTTEDVAQMLWPGVKLAHCPERVAPGCLLHNLRYVPRIIGGYTQEATELAAAFYLQVVATSELHLTDALTAEITKTFENAYRDVQIALANELALICQDLDADVWEVRKLVNTCPGRTLLEPGPGVGGPCLTKDTWLLASSMSEPPEMLLIARAINDSMPSRVVDLLIGALRETKVALSGATVTILGVAYRESTSDVRESPAIKIMSRLGRAGCTVRFFDPHCDGYDGDLVQSLTDSDAAIIVTPHSEFANLNWRNLGGVMRHRILVDTRGMVKETPAGFIFRGLGRGTKNA